MRGTTSAASTAAVDEARALEDRPDPRRLELLTGEVAGSRVTVRVARLRYDTDPLNDAVAATRRLLESATPGVAPVLDLTVEQVRLEPRVGFDGRGIPKPRGPLTGLDTGGNGGTGFPSASLR